MKGDIVMSKERENEIMELETMETEDIEVSTDGVETESKGNSGLVAIVVGGALATAGLVYAGVKKLKKAKADQPKKPKTKWKLVRVPVETEVDEFEDDFEQEDEQ